MGSLLGNSAWYGAWPSTTTFLRRCDFAAVKNRPISTGNWAMRG